MGKGTITGGGTAGLYQVNIEYNIDYLKKKKEQILKLIEECEKKIDAVELEITPIINKINDIYIEIRDLTAESSLLSAELTPLREQVEPLAQEIKTLKSEISELEGEITGLEAEKARLEGLEETPEILAQIAVIESNINYKEFSRDNKQAELDLNEANLSNINSQISEKESQIKANLKTLDVKEQELQEQQRFRDSLDRKKKILNLYLLSYQKKIADINSVNETENKDVWCVDYSENIEAETVGLIEVHEENATRYNIRPGYDPDLVVYDSARDGQESPIKAQTAAQAFYNLALFPAWQKWKPFYRYAVITEKRGNVADVDILDYKSPYQNIDINKLKSLTDVDIEYMSCNGAAFEIDDVVVVQFDGNSWDTPKIIGFKEEPRQCEGVVAILSLRGTKYIAWDLLKNELFDFSKIGETISQPFTNITYVGGILVNSGWNINSGALVKRVFGNVTTTGGLAKPAYDSYPRFENISFEESGDGAWNIQWHWEYADATDYNESYLLESGSFISESFRVLPYKNTQKHKKAMNYIDVVDLGRDEKYCFFEDELEANHNNVKDNGMPIINSFSFYRSYKYKSMEGNITTIPNIGVPNLITSTDFEVFFTTCLFFGDRDVAGGHQNYPMNFVLFPQVNSFTNSSSKTGFFKIKNFALLQEKPILYQPFDSTTINTEFTHPTWVWHPPAYKERPEAVWGFHKLYFNSSGIPETETDPDTEYNYNWNDFNEINVDAIYQAFNTTFEDEMETNNISAGFNIVYLFAL